MWCSYSYSYSASRSGARVPSTSTSTRWTLREIAPPSPSRFVPAGAPVGRGKGSVLDRSSTAVLVSRLRGAVGWAAHGGVGPDGRALPLALGEGAQVSGQRVGRLH